MKLPAALHSPYARLAIVVPIAGGIVALLYWRGPDWGAVGDAFTAVVWEWVAIAIGFNLLSVVVRALAWQRVIRTAMPPPHPQARLVFSAFSVGLFANAILPGRIGELARVAVLTRRMSQRTGAWATLVGTVFAHRVFDLVPVLMLIVYVLVAAKIPHWAIASLSAVVAVGLALFAFAFASARLHDRTIRLDAMSRLRRLVTMARHGLGVMRAPLPAAVAIGFQILGWACQLLAVWTAMRAFHIHKPLAAAALVLLVMNVVTVLPLWPGNVGALQVAIAIALTDYGVPKFRGIAFGFGLQAIEASVGVGFGLLFLAREGLSVAMLRVMPTATQAEVSDPTAEGDEEEGTDTPRARAGVSG